ELPTKIMSLVGGWESFSCQKCLVVKQHRMGRLSIDLDYYYNISWSWRGLYSLKGFAASANGWAAPAEWAISAAGGISETTPLDLKRRCA
ncbi:MAG: hypothetical protein KKC78_17370, partial [Proteobacteria bacterium]|nr:hypothetical protein [Pseudomonadota bacterium]